MGDALRGGDLKVLTADRWRSIEPILDAVLELPPEQRRAYVRVACARDAELLGDVEQLLAAHEVPALDVDTPAVQRFAALLDDEHLQLPEILDGRYKIGPMLGRGGMATVFLADPLPSSATRGTFTTSAARRSSRCRGQQGRDRLPVGMNVVSLRPSRVVPHVHRQHGLRIPGPSS